MGRGLAGIDGRLRWGRVGWLAGLGVVALLMLAGAGAEARTNGDRCRSMTDREHASAARKIIRRAHDRKRILDRTPARRAEVEAWESHISCVGGRDLRRALRRKARRAAHRFDAYFSDLISPPGARTLRARRECETGGDYEEGKGGLSGYRGAYQFDRYSWDRTAKRFRRRTGLRPDPSRTARPREQDIRAAIWDQMADRDPWPNCP